MIILTKGNTEIVYFTGSELATLSNPFFLFVFTNRVTNDIVKVMATNTSTTLRYDKFALIVDDYFTDKDNGFWEYQIIEKALNTDLTTTGNIVENGFMYLNASTVFAPTEYASQSNSFVTYNGNE